MTYIASKYILERVEKINNIKLDRNDVEVKDIENDSATIKAKKDSKKYKGSTVVKFNHEITDLEKVIIKTNLGKIKANNQFQIKERIVELNDTIDTDDFYVEANEIKNDKAKIILTSGGRKKYKGKVWVTFNAEKLVPKLDSYIKNDDNLGPIKSNSWKEILNALEKKYKDLVIDELEVKDIEEESAIIKAKPNSIIYRGYVKVLFSIEK